MKWLAHCLNSTKPFSVIVVDNCSRDGTIDFIKENHPNINVYQQEKNLGFGQANNIGIKHALDKGAEAVFLLNQDAYLQKDTLKKLNFFSKNHPHFGILSPIHLDSTEKRMDRNFSYYLNFDNNKDFYSDAILGELKESYEVPFVNAAGWFIPKSTLTIVGGFDPIFFHYGEDDNFCQRLRFHKLKIGIITQCFLIHDRENREKPVVLKYSKQYLQGIENSLKVKWGDLHVDFTNFVIKNIKKQQLKTFIKLLLKGRIKKFQFHFALYYFHKKWIKEIRNSRKINKTIGKHYLK